MENAYVEKRQAGYWVADTRVSLDSVVRAFQDGWSPEAIATEGFPTLTLEQVYGAIAYYLGHRREIDAYLEQSEAAYESEREAHPNPAFSQKMSAARRRLQPSRR